MPGRAYDILAPRAYTFIMGLALFCTLAVKFFHSLRYEISGEFFGWILADVACLLLVEVVLSLSCSTWPRKWIVRTATIIAAVMCTWSVMNAAWLIRTGNQILPRVLLSLIRAPISSFCIVGVNLIKMPGAALILLVPSAIALAFFFSCLARPRLPAYNSRRFRIRIALCLATVGVAVALMARPAAARHGSTHIGSVGLRHNSQLRAVLTLVLSDFREPTDPKRTIPAFDQIKVQARLEPVKRNIVVVVLEGVQYRYTSMADPNSDLTPFMARLGAQGAIFRNMRSSLTHTTKALFALFNGHFPAASQDIVETVPAAKPYGGLATVLRDKLGYRTAFFQSAMGSFEGRPGLIHNLGFEEFWARDDLGDPNAFIGYLGCDEFSMLKPVTDWIKQDKRPFLAVVLCSVSHDPYVVPEWFAEPAKEPEERYRQAVSYTDKFIAALEVELTKLHLTDEMIFCVVGDHGEAFGEHGLLGHERIAFDELLRIPFCLRAPSLVEPGTEITKAASSVDFTPTLLGLMGFETGAAGFDGWDVLGQSPPDRKIFFCGWMWEGPAGYIQGNNKFVYDPTERIACQYDLEADPFEMERIELPEPRMQEVADEIIAWRKGTAFKANQVRTGKTILFGRWQSRWTNRVSSVKYTGVSK